MIKKAKTPKKLTKPSTEQKFDDVFVTAITNSKFVESLSKSITKVIDSKNHLIDLWSFIDEPHSIERGEQLLLRKKTQPDGKVFYALQ